MAPVGAPGRKDDVSRGKWQTPCVDGFMCIAASSQEEHILAKLQKSSTGTSKKHGFSDSMNAKIMNQDPVDLWYVWMPHNMRKSCSVQRPELQSLISDSLIGMSPTAEWLASYCLPAMGSDRN